MSAQSTDDDLAPVQRTVDAASAPPIAGAALASPFAAAAAYLNTPATTVNRGASELPGRLKKTLEACGALNVQQIAEALAISYDQAQKVASNTYARGLIARVRSGVKRHGGSTFSALAPAANNTGDAPRSGFKRWLANQGESTAEGRPKRARKEKGQIPTAPGQLVPAPPGVAAAEPALRYALFSDGALRIEIGDQALVLPPRQASELLAYAAGVAHVLGGH